MIPIAPRIVRRASIIAASLLLVSCGSEDSPSVLEPAGPAAERVERLWWPMLAIPLGLALLAAVMLIALVDQVRALGSPRPDEVPPPETSA